LNAVEIEEAVSELAVAPFDAAEFPFAFLSAFGNKETTVKRLRSASANSSDVEGGVLQRNNIHIAVCPEDSVGETLIKLRASPKTVTNKAKFILATDGLTLEAEDVNSGEAIACEYPKFADHFGFFLPLAGISTVRAIKNNPIDIKATGRLNKLYVELLKDNPDWATDARRPEMNQFMARLIFCFFAEDTGIFQNHLFTKTIGQMSDSQTGNTHEVLAELFRAMDMHPDDLSRKSVSRWADAFPYVNGGLFKGSAGCPRFSRIARSYLLRAAELNWKEINPDIFGSMIQAVADDEERGDLGMHYTSVPNILKVLNPLFLDNLSEQLEAAGDNLRKLRNLRKRLSTIRVFDPACGSGNFLVIAYIKMREIEHEIIRRTGDGPKSWISLANCYGIEIKGFAAEIARLALLIAEFQCDVRMISQQEARLNVLPLHKTGQVRTGNALRLDWLGVCPPTRRVESRAADLFGIEPAQAEIDFETNEAETYICGNPPYLGGKGQSKDQKEDLSIVFADNQSFGELDYVAGWFAKATSYLGTQIARAAFVTTNSINQGAQVHQLWPRVYSSGVEIKFAYKPFKWSNNATANAAVICTIIGLGRADNDDKQLIDANTVQTVKSIGPYLVPGHEIIISQSLSAISELPPIITGNSPYDGGNLILTSAERGALVSRNPKAIPIVRRMYGSLDFLNGHQRFCLWITDALLPLAESINEISERISRVRESRRNGGDVARGLVNSPHRFRYIHTAERSLIIVPRVSSESREYIPFGFLGADCIISDSAQAIYDPEIWVFAILMSKIHMIWVRTVSGKLKSDIRYSSALCYNTFPVPPLTEKNKADLTRCAEEILLARETHFPATMADIYDPENMPDDLRAAHERNDEALERIYIGRRFRNDTERLEKLFDLYAKMTADKAPKKSARKGAA
jgi:hypothetical protein